MELGKAYELISAAIDAGRAANGYLIVGDLKAQGLALTDRLLRKLFPDRLEQIEKKCHPDVVWLEPQGRSRTIKVERGKDDDGPGVRDGLVAPMAETSFSGGWKVGVIVGADRMQPAAANAFLKSLEEPTPKTLYLLLTDAPEGLLPTIVSRTQRIDLRLGEERLPDEAYDAVAEVMTATGLDSVFARAQAARRLAEVLDGLKKAAADADVPQVRRLFFKTVLGYVRRWMVEERLPFVQAARNVEAVEEAYRQCERHLPDEPVICFMMDRMAFPAAEAETGGEEAARS